MENEKQEPASTEQIVQDAPEQSTLDSTSNEEHVESEVETPSSQEDGLAVEPASEDEKLPASVKKRIDKLTFRAKSEEERNKVLSQQLNTLQQQRQLSQEDPHAPQKPKKEDFNNPADYVDAIMQYNEKKSVYETHKREEITQQQQYQSYLTDLDRKHSERVAEVKEKYPDIEEVTQHILQPQFLNHPNFLYLSTTVMSSAKSAELQYYFGKNPAEIGRLLSKAPLEAAMEIGRLEGKLNTPPKKSASNKPAPPTRMKGEPASGGAPKPSIEDARKEARLLQINKR